MLEVRSPWNLEIIKKSLKLKSKLNIINISSNTIKFFGSKKNTTYLVSKNALEISLLNLSKSFVKKNISRWGYDLMKIQPLAEQSDVYSQKNINPICFVDNNFSNWDKKFNGYDVISPEKLQKEYSEKHIFLSSLNFKYLSLFLVKIIE